MHKSLRVAPKRGLVAALAGLALVLAACGSGQDTALETGVETPAADVAESADAAESDAAESDAEVNESENSWV